MTIIEPTDEPAKIVSPDDENGGDTGAPGHRLADSAKEEREPPQSSLHTFRDAVGQERVVESFVSKIGVRKEMAAPAQRKCEGIVQLRVFDVTARDVMAVNGRFTAQHASHYATSR